MQEQGQQLSSISLPPTNFKTAFEQLCSGHELLTCGKNRCHIKAYSG
jgi:hypothetical protein